MTGESRRVWYLHPLTLVLLMFIVAVAFIAVVGRYAWQRTAALAWLDRTGGIATLGAPPQWVPKSLSGYWPRWALPVEFLRVGPKCGEVGDQLDAFREVEQMSLSG